MAETWDELSPAQLPRVVAILHGHYADATQPRLELRVVLLRQGQYWPGWVALATFTVRDKEQGLASLAFNFVLAEQRHFSPSLPLVVVGLPVTPVAGGEGATP